MDFALDPEQELIRDSAREFCEREVLPHVREWFESAEIREGDRLVRPARVVGQPEKETEKEAVSIPIDADVLAYFRATGPGWQSRINEALRRAAGLPS